jgi:hypothetical protein
MKGGTIIVLETRIMEIQSFSQSANVPSAYQSADHAQRYLHLTLLPLTTRCLRIHTTVST